MGLFCSSASSLGTSRILGLPGKGLRRTHIPGKLSPQAGGAGFKAATLSPQPVAWSAFTAHAALSFRATVSSRLCQALGFLCWSDVLSRFCCVLLCATPWTLDCQAPLSMGFSRQESWSGLPFSSLEDLPDPGTEPRSPALLYPLSHQEAPRNWENKFPAEAGAGPGRGTTDPHGGPQGLGQGSACVPGRRKENQRGDTPRPERCGRVLRTRAAWGQPPVSPAAGTGRPAD